VIYIGSHIYFLSFFFFLGGGGGPLKLAAESRLINLDLKVAAQISNTLPNSRPLEKRVVPIFLNFERQLQANDLNLNSNRA
jgi:hypothetical protein